eukprot:UN14077
MLQKTFDNIYTALYIGLFEGKHKRIHKWGKDRDYWVRANDAAWRLADYYNLPTLSMCNTLSVLLNE